MPLPIKPPFLPMEAENAAEIPQGDNWQYEPKWDGFRCLAFRDGADIELQSKAGQPLARYFPEMVEGLLALRAKQFVLDGEIVIPLEGNIAFDQLLMRIHPAESRVRKLAAEHPGLYLVFDLLVDDRGEDLIEEPLRVRREHLERFAAKYFRGSERVAVSPVTRDFEEARRWFSGMAGGLDEVVAKDITLPYRSGERVMEKIKNRRTADCVVGGFRYQEGKRVVGSLLLGLYDNAGLLNHVGFTSSIHAADKPAVTKKLEKLIEPPGFTGSAPGGPSRWNRGKSNEWEPLRPELVCEVQYDHFSGGRFRHGTKFLHWRPDKAPRQCTMKQVERESQSPLDLLGAA